MYPQADMTFKRVLESCSSQDLVYPRFRSSWEKDFTALLSDDPPVSNSSPDASSSPNSVWLAEGPPAPNELAEILGQGGSRAALRHSVRQQRAWLAVRRRAPLLLAILQARLAGLRAHMDLLRHTVGKYTSTNPFRLLHCQVFIQRLLIFIAIELRQK